RLRGRGPLLPPRRRPPAPQPRLIPPRRAPADPQPRARRIPGPPLRTQPRVVPDPLGDHRHMGGGQLAPPVPVVAGPAPAARLMLPHPPAIGADDHGSPSPC